MKKEIIKIKELLVQYEVEGYVLHLLENEIIRIGIVMGDLQKRIIGRKWNFKKIYKKVVDSVLKSVL